MTDTDLKDNETKSAPQIHDPYGDDDDWIRTNPVEVLTDGAMIEIFKNDEGRNAFHVRSRGKKNKQTTMCADLVNYLSNLQEEIAEHIPGKELDIYTRHKRGSSIWHAHPNYRGTGPWNDWVLIDWGREGILPANIHCFIDLESYDNPTTRIEYGGIWLKSGTYAVVETSNYEEEDEECRNSEIFVPILKEVASLNDSGNKVLQRKFYLADVEAFNDVACVVPDIGGPPNRYFFVHKRSFWPDLFIKWVKQPHREDEMSEEEVEPFPEKKARRRKCER